MKHPIVLALASAVAASLFAGSAALADDDRGRDRDARQHESRHDDGKRHERRQERRVDRRDHGQDRRQGHRKERRQDRHKDFRKDLRHDHRDARRRYVPPRRFDVGRYHRPQGYRHQAWRTGTRLPRAYYAPRYVVHNYRDYRLYAPPRGHHWVRVDNNVVLAAIAGGVVTAVVLDLFR